MKANLKLHYYTHEGSKLQIVPAEGKPVDMRNEGNGVWSTVIELHSDRPYRYAYQVVEGRKLLRKEWGKGHSLTEIAGCPAVDVIDHWCDAPQLKKEAERWHKFQADVERTFLRPNKSDMKWQ